jgi:hypothetical protein
MKKTKTEMIKPDQAVLKFIKRRLRKRIKEMRPKIIFGFPLNVKIKEIGKRKREKRAKEFGVPTKLKEMFLVKSMGKIKTL